MSLKSIVLAFIGFILILGYQNCSRPPDVAFTQVSSKATNETDENGRPYDGKIYLLIGETCPDRTKVRSRIVVKSSTSADLVRYNCEEIAPVALGAADFQMNPSNPQELKYQNQTYINALVGTKIDTSLSSPDYGYCFMLVHDFGTPPDNSTSTTQSLLQIYEDGKPLGPAHAPHADIRSIGLGRFSHWLSNGLSVLRFSASDNTDPRTNGRTYTWEVRN